MKQQILLGEIPSCGFHSAIFTTYSINLYYFEQQVLPLLGSKRIYYVSVLADSEMLSSQLDSLSSLSENKKRTYAINGMQSKGAFHSKLIFLAGDTKLLLLMGSGNLTSSGHGKNLEVWNAFYVDSFEDSKLGFLLQAWNYIKQLHQDLGQSATNKIKIIEENCSLLKTNIKIFEKYVLDDETQISFLYSQPEKSIFSQLLQLIGEEEIHRITIMSPFYDSDGKFIQQLNNTFKPQIINVILQKQFGNAPTSIKATENIHFHDWGNIKCDTPQKFFHAKNIVFEGKDTSYMLSGSANASIAAFGLRNVGAVNQEACVLYQSKSTDYINLLGLKLKKHKELLSDFEHLNGNGTASINGSTNVVFIRSAELNYDVLSLQLSLGESLSNITICVLDAKGKTEFEKQLDISNTDKTIKITIPQTLHVMYCYIKDSETIISNKQFVTDIHAFESTIPSQKNRAFNELRKIIESEGFSTLRIIDYLSEIYQSTDPEKKISAASDKKDKTDDIFEEDNDLGFLSYQQIQSKIKHFDNSRNGRAYVEYQSVRLWESISSYLKDNYERNNQSRIDEEETENVNESSGREEVVQPPKKQSISRPAFVKRKASIENCLKDYVKTIEAKIESAVDNKPSIIDLSMYLIMMEILLQHVNTKETIFEESRKSKYSKVSNEPPVTKEEFLINPKISSSSSSWSSYTLKIMGLFNLWWNKAEGFKDIDNQEYKDKFKRYKSDAFNMSVLAISIFEHLNRNQIDNGKIKLWVNLELLNFLHCFSDHKLYTLVPDDYLMFLNEESNNAMINELHGRIMESIDFMKGFVNNVLYKNFSIQKGSGYIYWDSIFCNSLSNRSIFKTNTYLLFMGLF